MRRSILIVLILVVLGGAGAVFAGGAFRGMAEPEGTAVRMEPVKAGTLVETVSAPGTVEPISKVDISAEVSARIVEIPFPEGKRVTKGAVVLRLDDRDLKAALAATESRRDGERFRMEAEKARIEGPLQSLANARQNMERQQKLFDTGDVSRGALDDAITKVRDLEAQVLASRNTITVIEKSLATAEAQIEQAKEALRKTVVVSNIDGIITQLNAEVGELVVVGTMNNPGTKIMTIADLSRMQLAGKVTESDIAKVAEGQAAEVRVIAYKNRVFKGTVTEVALQRTTEKDGTGYFKVEVLLDLEGDQLFSGVGGNVDIVIGTHQGLVLPSQAIVERKVDDLPADVRDRPEVASGRKTTPVVFRVVDGKAMATPVETGASNLLHIFCCIFDVFFGLLCFFSHLLGNLIYFLFKFLIRFVTIITHECY